MLIILYVGHEIFMMLANIMDQVNVQVHVVFSAPCLYVNVVKKKIIFFWWKPSDPVVTPIIGAT